MGEKELKEAVAKITISDFSKNTAVPKNGLSGGPIQLGNVKDQADLIDRSLSKIRKDEKQSLQPEKVQPSVAQEKITSKKPKPVEIQ